MNPSAAEFDFSAARQTMLDKHLHGRDIHDENVLRVMGEVPREFFLPPSDWDEAYADRPLRIGCEQTISQPYIVAYMTQLLALTPGMRVLEIGTGSGYQTAILAALGAEVFTIERHEPLLEQAIQRLTKIGYAEKIAFCHADGTLGWEEEAPFDRILITAAAPEIPTPLTAQLADNGRLVAPVGESEQRLVIVNREGNHLRRDKDLEVSFVPLIGEKGFRA